ncbi:ribonuclease PH [Deinococcus roseus]|uniref:Ribonuclease PH n=1 Tax=Deinococcus roseus TaxID=392414 RepID=A0ABQ2CUJ4_9DEIO|nr:ribonuclease PH [Deinococcus roseus]GGJ21967.1 ribonuclease PH [Deinococcus roseus]
MPRSTRGTLELRPLKVSRKVNRYAEGSCLIEMGHTKVLVTATLEKKVPFHVKGTKQGWLMAEYNLLPRATHERISRERVANGGRTQEIQRLMGRAFRSCVDLNLFRDQTIIIDADVIQADGGTRVASIIGGYVALHDLTERLFNSGKITDWALTHEIGAISVGMVDGEIRVDLDYQEDVKAEADLNIIATGSGQLIEVQGGTEKDPIDKATFDEMVEIGVLSVQDIVKIIKEQI